MSGTVELLEFTQISQAREVDEAAGVLRGLKILGNVSANDRDYPPATVESGAARYRGRPSNANHRPRGKDQDVNDRLGVWVDTYSEGGQLYGDFAYLKTHPLAARLVEAAKRPELHTVFGFSHNIRGRTRQEGGRTVVESIDEVHSIDLVADPATVAGLYESRQTMSTARQLAESLKTSRPKFAAALSRMIREDVVGPDMAMAPPADAPAGDGDHEAALYAAAKACIDDTSLGVAEKLQKIKKILGLVDGGGGSAEPPAGPAEESRRTPADDVRLLREELAVRDLIEGLTFSGSEARKAFARALVPLSAAERTALIEERRTIGGRGGNPPRSSAPNPPTVTRPAKDLRESRQGGGGRDTVEDFVESLGGGRN